MEKNQQLIKEHDVFSSTSDDLSNRYDSLSVDYGSLSNEILNRNQELESLKVSYNVLAKGKASLVVVGARKMPWDG